MKHAVAVLIILLSLFPVFSDPFKKYENGYLMSVENNYEDGTTDLTTYIYSDGNLVCTEFTSRDGNRSVEYYIRNASDLSLFAVRRYENTVLIGTDYIYTDENLYRKSHDLVSTGDFNVDSSGNISFSRNGTVFTYGPESELLSEEDSNSIVYYNYEEGVLVSKRSVTKTQPVTVVITDYNNSGSVTSESTYINNMLTQKIEYQPDGSGMIKTVYNNSKPVARVYYKSDNKKVAKVEYL